MPHSCHDAHLPARSQLTCLSCRALLHVECALSQSGCAACGGDAFAPAELRRAELGPWELHPGPDCVLLRREPRDLRPLSGELRLGLDLLHLERGPEGLLGGSLRLELPREQRLGALSLELVELSPRRLRRPRERVLLSLDGLEPRDSDGSWPGAKRPPGTYVCAFRVVLPRFSLAAGARLLARARLRRRWSQDLLAELEWRQRSHEPAPQPVS